ncbi:IQ domain-containing protein E-like isoform X2 [Orbicella faveolata]|uniref:IQ domain-containing protein E-like isoform X2 n=1 Tax=Orbicella faveolata TaxID=48498 RepID=UPI0009E1D79C|nr:IQ domain-containing protein E-like isoform X2 [Orbicella faveolata]
MPIPGVTVEDVDAYSDVSNGSTISVGSAASGGSGHMPRPPSGGSRRSKSVQGRRSLTAKSPYSSTQIKGSSKQQPPKPAARNMWITAMRNGTATLSTENSPMKTWAGTRASYGKQSRSGTRARHLSDFVQVEDLKNKNHVRSASMSASEPHLSSGGPAYKPPEDYYDEVIELKKIINALKAENNVINTKLRRVEGENVLKDRKMEDLLNTRKQPEDVRRTLTDKKGDTSAIVNSLKQKLHAVERTVKDKEAELSQLKKDIKMTNIEELQIQSETYYQEVQRLQLALLEMQQSQVQDSFGRTSPRNNTLSKGTKGKPTSVSLQRLAEENDHLKAENRSLKKDLLTAIETGASGNRKVPLKADYADMNRGQLLAKIRELEEQVQESDGKGALARKESFREDKEDDTEVRRKSISKLTSQVPGRLELKGTTSQKLAQLQEREIELLEEREKQREVIERLKEDRAHYRSVSDDLRLQLKSTQEELDRLRDEKGAAGERRRSSASITSPTRKSSLKEVPVQDDHDEDLDRMLNDFQQQRAAKALQRQWRGYRGRKKQQIEEQDREREERVERENQAASTLQKNWRTHRERIKQREEDDKEKAIEEIQAALRGHAVRNKHIKQLDEELEFTDRDDAVVTIQSAMRAHSARKRHLGCPEEVIKSRDTRTRGSSSRNVLDSEPDSDEGVVTKPSSSKRHPEPAVTGLRRSSSTGPRRSLITAPRFSNISEQSEEEDTRVTSPKRSGSLQKRSAGLVNVSAPNETGERPKKKTFEIVDSDDEDDDDDDDAIVSRSRRSLDTGVSQQRPSLSRSRRALSPPSTSPREESRVAAVESRPGLSRTTGHLVTNRDLGDSESNKDENLQRPGLSRSKRPLSGKRSGSNRSSGGVGGSNKEKENSGTLSSTRTSLTAGSEEDSEDDVIVTGKKKRATGDEKTAARPSLTRKSPASTLPVSSQRGSIASSLDNFFSSTVQSKESSGKKSPRRTLAQFNDSDDDVDDDDDDEDEIVVSSLSRSKSKQKEKSSTGRTSAVDSG